MPKLGVNVDHVATLRQARGETDPNPIKAAKICVKAGADSIVCHLREDRRHIQDLDAFKIKRAINVPLNFEMSINDGIIKIARKLKPAYAMLVPEKREEVTTEGGLDVIKHARRVKRAIKQLSEKNITVSVFIDPKLAQIKKAKELGAKIIELHTGTYANAKTTKKRNMELAKIKKTAQYAHELGLVVHAGHGLKYHNTRAIARIKYIDELNIGHAIISEAVFVGLPKAVRKMKKIVKN